MKLRINFLSLFSLIFIGSLNAQEHCYPLLEESNLDQFYCLRVKTGTTYYYTYMYGFHSPNYDYIESTSGQVFDTLSECVAQYKCPGKNAGGFRYGKEYYTDQYGNEKMRRTYSYMVESPCGDMIRISKDSADGIDRCEDILKKVLLRVNDEN